MREKVTKARELWRMADDALALSVAGDMVHDELMSAYGARIYERCTRIYTRNGYGRNALKSSAILGRYRMSFYIMRMIDDSVRKIDAIVSAYEADRQDDI